MKVTRPLAHKLQDGLQVIMGLIEMEELERAKAAIRAISQLISDQTVKSIEIPKPSEDLEA